MQYADGVQVSLMGVSTSPYAWLSDAAFFFHDPRSRELLDEKSSKFPARTEKQTEYHRSDHLYTQFSVIFSGFTTGGIRDIKGKVIS